jgi:hypothetical protein
VSRPSRRHLWRGRRTATPIPRPRTPIPILIRRTQPRRRPLLTHPTVPPRTRTTIAFPMLRPLVHRLPRPVHMPKIPRRARNDRQPTPRAHRPTGRNHPTPRLSKLLMVPAISSSTRLPIHPHVVSPANSGRDFLTARVSGAAIRKKMRRLFGACALVRRFRGFVAAVWWIVGRGTLSRFDNRGGLGQDCPRWVEQPARSEFGVRSRA